MQLTQRPAADVRKHTRHAEPAPAEVAGGLNIVPFLDIVTNLILFLLMTSAQVLIVAELEAHLPSLSRGRRASSTPDEGSTLNLSVTVAENGIIVAGTGGKLAPGCERMQPGRVITVPRRIAPRQACTPTSSCPGQLQCGPDMVCDDPRVCGDDSFDWGELTRCAARVHRQFPDETQVIISADPNIEYEAILCAMDALRADGADVLFPDVMLSAGVR